MEPILITGATGNIGKHVASMLRVLGKSVRVATRHTPMPPEHTYLDLSRPSTYDKFNFIDTRDIAEIAVKALTDPRKHSKKEYTLSGSVALTFPDVVHALSNELSHTIVFHDITAARYFLRLLKSRESLVKALVQTILHVGIRSGQANIVNKSAVELLERDTTSLKQYLKENRSNWI
ncbi:hypothetical protein H4F17_06210 [Vibrio cholerae]